MKFKIGDKVVYKYLNDDEVGVVTDILCGKETDSYLYAVDFDGKTRYEQEFCLDPVIEKPAYRFTIDIAESVHNVVIATMIEERGCVETEICRGHGHVIHEGTLGIAQAASYAMRCIYKALEGKKDA